MLAGTDRSIRSETFLFQRVSTRSLACMHACMLGVLLA